MKLIILRTDIKTRKKVKTVRPLFNSLPTIKRWSVDTEDIDNVLRIEAEDNTEESDIIHLVKTYGFYCEALPD